MKQTKSDASLAGSPPPNKTGGAAHDKQANSVLSAGKPQPATQGHISNSQKGASGKK